jgi:hypothetical protein
LLIVLEGWFYMRETASCVSLQIVCCKARLLYPYEDAEEAQHGLSTVAIYVTDILTASSLIASARYAVVRVDSQLSLLSRNIGSSQRLTVVAHP